MHTAFNQLFKYNEYQVAHAGYRSLEGPTTSIVQLPLGQGTRRYCKYYCANPRESGEWVDEQRMLSLPQVQALDSLGMSDERVPGPGSLDSRHD